MAQNNEDPNSMLDDDGRVKRTGTWMTATAHIITGVIGSGVLSLAWAISQLGWVAGTIVLIAFSVITWYCSTLLADCYRHPDPVHGRRNYTYMDAVKVNLGGLNIKLCGVAQYINLVGICIGYTITSAICMAAVKKSNCFHNNHSHDGCKVANNDFMIIFMCVEVVLSQIPNFHKLWVLSIIASVMSFAYSSIGVGLSLARIIQNGGLHVRTSLTGTTIGVDVTSSEKFWKVFQALGNIALAYSFSTILIEIQDTLKSSPPENKVMKKATFIGVAVTTIFYMLCGLLGYAAFGNRSPGNFLTGFGFYEPFWLVDFANVCIVVHLIGAYQVYCQPIYGFVESKCASWWPNNKFMTRSYMLNIPVIGVSYNLNLFRLVWRTSFVIATTLTAMLFPFFNDFLGLLGALVFWPLTVNFPVVMYMNEAKIKKYTCKWTCLHALRWGCFVVSFVAAVGCIQGLITSVRTYQPFNSVS